VEPDSKSPVLLLYLLARDGGEPMTTDTQRQAIRMLGDLSISGNREAREALVRLCHLPEYHILLREIAAASPGTGTSFVS
jgi:hypothetical protein